MVAAGGNTVGIRVFRTNFDTDKVNCPSLRSFRLSNLAASMQLPLGLICNVPQRIVRPFLHAALKRTSPLYKLLVNRCSWISMGLVSHGTHCNVSQDITRLEEGIFRG